MNDNRISKEDLTDQDFVDAEELASDGYTVSYRSVTLVSTTSATRDVVISVTASYDGLSNVDSPLQVGDIVEIPTGVSSGRYLVESIVNPLDTFRVKEPIPDSTFSGTANFYHPAGATKIGVDTSNLSNSDGYNLQEVLEDLDAAAGKAPDCIGQVLFSVDGETFEVVQPVTSNQGWLVNDQGILIVKPQEDE
jgi:hypothetical protein